MGFRISLLGFQDTSVTDALAAAGLVDTGEHDEANEAFFSGAAVPGWYLLWVNDFDYASAERLARLSAGRTVLGVQVHEGVMVANVACYRDGEQHWAITHTGCDAVRDLEAWGDLPAIFAGIRDQQFADQDAEDAGAAEVDHIFEIPLLVAKGLTGLKHDEVPPVEWRFTRLEPISTGAKPSLLRRLFG